MAIITSSQAQDYMDLQLNTSAWDTATTNDRTAAIAQASISIERLNFKEYVDLTAPSTDIKYAVAQMALDLLDGIDIELELENLRLTNQQFGNVKTSYNTLNPPHYLVNGISSQKAWNFLKPHLRDGHNITLRRTS